MEYKNITIKKFISSDEVNLIIDWIDNIKHNVGDPNYHLSEISNVIKGKSAIYDISNTDYTKYITNFQSISGVLNDDLPTFIHNIIDRLSIQIGLPKEHIYLQAIDMNKGGKIHPHYDASVKDHINYKCNISVLSEDYKIYIGDDVLDIEQTDLYCFEASLYKHWTNEFNSRRILLSFGFIIPYSVVNRNENDPRVRLSKRIEKHFQNIKTN